MINCDFYIFCCACCFCFAAASIIFFFIILSSKSSCSSSDTILFGTNVEDDDEGIENSKGVDEFVFVENVLGIGPTKDIVNNLSLSPNV